MPYTVIIHRDAKKDIKKLHPQVRKRVISALARISHPRSTAAAQWHALRGFRSVGLLNRVSTMPARPSVAKAAYHAPLSRLATNGGEKCGLELMEENPRLRGSEKMSGYADLYKYRVGHYRIIYRINDDGLEVHEDVYLENHTKTTLEIQAEFKMAYGQDCLKFVLKSNEHDAWEHEVPHREQNNTINNEGYPKQRQHREAVSEIAIKRDMWELHIDDKIMNCQI